MLADFGFAHFTTHPARNHDDNPDTMTEGGTPTFTAPEQKTWDNRNTAHPGQGQVSNKSVVWQIGATMWSLMCTLRRHRTNGTIEIHRLGPHVLRQNHPVGTVPMHYHGESDSVGLLFQDVAPGPGLGKSIQVHKPRDHLANIPYIPQPTNYQIQMEEAMTTELQNQVKKCLYFNENSRPNILDLYKRVHNYIHIHNISSNVWTHAPPLNWANPGVIFRGKLFFM